MYEKKFISLFVGLAISIGTCFAQKAYKEIEIDGVKQKKWMDVEYIETYDRDGRIIQNENVKDGYVATWEYEGAMLMSTEKRTYNDGRTRTIMYDNLGNKIYEMGESGNAKTFEIWYEYDSRGNETFYQYEEYVNKDFSKKIITKWQYDDVKNTAIGKCSDGKEIQMKIVDGNKNFYSKKWEKPFYAQFPSWVEGFKEEAKRLEGVDFQVVTGNYEELWEDFNPKGEKIHTIEKKADLGSRGLQGCRDAKEVWFDYNEEGDIIQTKTQLWCEDVEGNIIDKYKASYKIIITNTKSTVSTTKYVRVYDYEYYDDGKLKKKTCYWCYG